MGTGLRIYMMVIKDARQRNIANMAISMGKQHTDCPTDWLIQPELRCYSWQEDVETEERKRKKVGGGILLIYNLMDTIKSDG